MKRIATISIWIVGLAGLSVLVGFIEKEHQKITCKSIEVLLDYEDADPLIDADMIKSDVYKTYDSLIGKRISEIDQVEIEDFINQNNYVDNAEVFSTLTGHLKIKVTQKKPIIRIINNKGQHYYIDEKGTAMMVKSSYTTRLLVASGHIPATYADTINLIKNENFPVLQDLYNLALHIRSNEFLEAQIEQIYVNEDQEYELIPKVGRQLIIFGDITDMEEKFDKLIVFYQKGMKKAGWDTYRTINLKFKDQVVCAKN
ncbi:MAG: hypothetical protein KQI35_15830 [Bacteroidetes bacterium]|nr:hypothetical protein [Bacteroidota bacterium]